MRLDRPFKVFLFFVWIVSIQTGCWPEYADDEYDSVFSPGYGDAGLQYRTVDGDPDGDGEYFSRCSAYWREIQFGLEDKSPDNGGYIIQHIYIDNPVTLSCSGSSYNEDYYNYWEAFEFPPHSNIGGKDTFAIMNKKADDGEWEMTGSAVYFPTMTEADLIDAGFVDGAYMIDEYPELYHHSMNTVGNYFTPVEPMFWGNVSLFRSVSITNYRCCSGTVERDSSDSHQY